LAALSAMLVYAYFSHAVAMKLSFRAGSEPAGSRDA
jgi:hypothetical protein